MKRFGIFFGGIVVLAAATGAAAAVQGSGAGSVLTTYDSSAENAVELLAGPERFAWQRPDRLLRLLSIREGEKVADLGAGIGYFTSTLSSIVGRSGTVYAVETDPELLKRLEIKAAGQDFDNTIVVRGSETDPNLPEDALDLILTVNTWHRLGDRRPMREAVSRALKPGGRFVVVDWHLGEIAIAPPVERRLPRAELIAEMVADGWTVTTNSRLLKYQYLLIFIPPAP